MSSLKISARLRVPAGVSGSAIIMSVHFRAAVASPDFQAESAKSSRAVWRKVAVGGRQRFKPLEHFGISRGVDEQQAGAHGGQILR